MGWDDYKVNVPEGALDGIAVERFTLDAEASRWTLLREQPGRHIPVGTYTRLIEGKRVWMSDTPAEFGDHVEAIIKMANPTTKRVLINGLGLGMVVKAALKYEHVEHVDVVEIDKRVIELVGPTYTADGRVHIHQGDAFDQAIDWPQRTRWDVVWHDIWPELAAENLPEMTKLARSYGRRAGWQGAWGKEHLRRERARDRRLDKKLKELWG